MPNDNDAHVTARLTAIEVRLAGLARRVGERKRARDGRMALCVRLGDEFVAQVRDTARQRGCTISQLMREALETVIPPSSAHLSDHPKHPSAFMAQRLDTPRQAISNSLAERARATAAGAATMADRRSRDQQTSAPGMMTEAMARRSGRLR